VRGAPGASSRGGFGPPDGSMEGGARPGSSATSRRAGSEAPATSGGPSTDRCSPLLESRDLSVLPATCADSLPSLRAARPTARMVVPASKTMPPTTSARSSARRGDESCEAAGAGVIEGPAGVIAASRGIHQGMDGSWAGESAVGAASRGGAGIERAQPGQRMCRPGAGASPRRIRLEQCGQVNEMPSMKPAFPVADGKAVPDRKCAVCTLSPALAFVQGKRRTLDRTAFACYP
jgi:hypothetical protein